MTRHLLATVGTLLAVVGLAGVMFTGPSLRTVSLAASAGLDDGAATAVFWSSVVALVGGVVLIDRFGEVAVFDRL